MHLSKARFPITSTFSGISIEVNPVQPLNAQVPILVTFSPIVILFKELQFSKAFGLISVTGTPSTSAGIVKLSAVPV